MAEIRELDSEESPDVSAERAGRRTEWPTTAWLLLVVCAAAVLVGVAVRAWLLLHQPLTGDEAIVALMAQQIRHGHFYSFYWGGAYGGAEPYLVAALTSVFGSGAVAVNLSATLLTAVSTVLVWSIVRSLVPPRARWVAYPAAAMFWVWPEAALWNSTRESGFRCVTLLAGLACLKLALRWATSGSWGDAAGLGLAFGVGWWSSPEIVYFLIPVVSVVAVAVYRPAARWSASKGRRPPVFGPVVRRVRSVAVDPHQRPVRVRVTQHEFLARIRAVHVPTAAWDCARKDHAHDAWSAHQSWGNLDWWRI